MTKIVAVETCIASDSVQINIVTHAAMHVMTGHSEHFAAFGSFDLRLAAIIGSGIFMLAAAGGHIYQMITAHNFAPGNAGIIFWSDIFLPLIGFALLWSQRRPGRDGRGS
jgi:hypothetical protein